MKIIVLHGDNSLASYDRLQKLISSARARSFEITHTGSDSRSLSEILSSVSLFTTDRLLVVEDIKLFTKKELQWISKHFNDNSTTLIIYTKNSLTKTFLNSFPKIDKVEEFTLPKNIWSLLDSFYPGNSKNCLILLHKLSPKEPVEFVFTLLAKLVRDLYWLKSDPKGLPYSPWRITKLQRQSQRYSLEKLKDIISELAEIDIKTKTSQVDLLTELDFLIATKLE